MKHSHSFLKYYVQSLNSPFFLPPIGAEPGQAKGESRITCMRMFRTPPFFPPKSGKNHIWKYFPDCSCGVIFWVMIYKQQFLHSDCLKPCQLINPKSVEFHQCHAKRHSICFFLITISKITKEIFAKICWQFKIPTHYANDCLYVADFPFKNNMDYKTFGKRVMTRTSCR